MWQAGDSEFGLLDLKNNLHYTVEALGQANAENEDYSNLPMFAYHSQNNSRKYS